MNKNGYGEIIISFYREYGGGSHVDTIQIFEIDTTYGIASKPKTFKSFNLSVSPNPAKGVVDIRYEIPVREAINLSIYDASGRLVKTLARVQNQEPGVYSKSFDIKDFPNGVYFLRLSIPNSSLTRKVIVVQ